MCRWQLWKEAYANCMDTARGPMSPLGTKRTWRDVELMSAFGGKADMGWSPRDVRFRPKADMVAGVDVVA
jgi:hypothetical protein